MTTQRITHTDESDINTMFKLVNKLIINNNINYMGDNDYIINNSDNVNNSKFDKIKKLKK